MLSVASPLWLLGLLALPVIWWLYRQSRRPKEQLVSAIWLWPESTESASDTDSRPFSDPRWWTYATLWVLFLLALSELSANGFGQPSLTVWLDDSLSMQTVEQGQTRQQLAIQTLQQWLNETDAGEISIRALGDHTKVVKVRSPDSTAWQTKLQRWSTANTPRLPSSFDSNQEHWLVTDGADAALLQPQRVHRLLQVGAERSNTALTHLSVRPNLLHPQDSLVAMFTTATFATGNLLRKLTIQVDGQVLATQALRLDDGEYQGEFSLPRASKKLTLTLEPADHLSLDDSLSLLLADLTPQSTLVDPSCPEPLQQALAAIPMIQLDDTNARQKPKANGASLSVLCDRPANSASETDETSAKLLPNTQNRIFMGGSSSTFAVNNPLRWHADAQAFNRLFLDARGLSAKVYDGPGQVLLSAGPAQQPLIVRNAHDTHVLLDLSAAQIVNEPAYPFLVAAIAQIATGKNLIDPFVSQSRRAAESRIGPLAQDLPLLDLNARNSAAVVPLTSLFLTLLIVLLLAEAISRSRFGKELAPRVVSLTTRGASS